MNARKLIEAETFSQRVLKEMWRVVPHSAEAFEIVPKSSYRRGTRWFQDSIATVQYREMADHIVAMHNASLSRKPQSDRERA